ncbi:MAG TPA: T9SS type A sorting domain-containing protein [Bacteroidota bacterium]|nr:T9SS type A sorting domain-containing protein [Bacteroidota bacterium]
MKRLFSLLMIALSISYLNAQTVYFVKQSGDDGMAGTSWETAFATLQKALSVAASGNQIWVAAGTYTPSTSSQSAKFQLKSGVAIYGGFAGTESSLEDRDWQTNVTTLSGDIDNDGTLNGNSYHVVSAISVSGTAVLDGFVITGGGGATDIGGGGIELLFASPMLSNLIITGNNSGTNSTDFGGGLYTDGGTPVLTNVTFSGNQTAGNGGGMYNSGAASLSNCTFTGNTAVNGGGLYNDASSVPSMTNIIFRNDTASSLGGGFYDNGNALLLQDILFDGNYATLGGGGMCNVQSGNSTFVNVTLYGNSSKYGGGMFFTNSSSARILNTIFWDDAATTSGSEVYNTSSGTVEVSHSILLGGLTGAGVGPNTLTDGGHNIDSDPLFTSPGSHDFTLMGSSLAIDSGYDTLVTATTDLAGNSRISNGTIDIGAYEFQGAPLPVELTSFNAIPREGFVMLQWSTVTESMCAGFTIERKVEALKSSGNNEQWTSIGFVQGHGSSTVPHQYSFSDKTLSAGQFTYRLKLVDVDGKFTYGPETTIAIDNVPTAFSLEQNYPNPFNPTTTIAYQTPTDGHVVIKVFDIAGKEVTTLVDEFKPAGHYTARFDASQLCSGTYFLSLKSGDHVSVKKMSLLK